ncbi:hypothetical protein [Chryseobacterium indoltheticum]|uniref:hypothetical protein n=1 Tax=Chryseobacterium indoltheticum TaxID=254 RepID=UPI001912328C|nr:hypothetical protein [Chryseobacterium indoltheticum]QQQ27422.1 hypothetical protein JJL46_15035 [Chryseobacterium indoltheticum]
MNISLPTSDQNFVENLIPQKFPFVMVNSISEYSEEHLVSGFTIKEENIFVHEGVFQASGLIEHQAQSVALHTGYKFYLLGKEAPTGYIGAIKTFQAETLPKIEDQLVSEVKIINEMMGVTLVQISTTVNNQVIATSEMKTVVK